jgi:hypothetical protein
MVQQISTYLLDRLNDEVSQIKQKCTNFTTKYLHNFLYLLYTTAKCFGHLQEVISAWSSCTAYMETYYR